MNSKCYILYNNVIYHGISHLAFITCYIALFDSSHCLAKSMSDASHSGPLHT